MVQEKVRGWNVICVFSRDYSSGTRTQIVINGGSIIVQKVRAELLLDRREHLIVLRADLLGTC